MSYQKKGGCGCPSFGITMTQDITDLFACRRPIWSQPELVPKSRSDHVIQFVPKVKPIFLLDRMIQGKDSTTCKQTVYIKWNLDIIGPHLGRAKTGWIGKVVTLSRWSHFKVLLYVHTVYELTTSTFIRGQPLRLCSRSPTTPQKEGWELFFFWGGGGGWDLWKGVD